MYPDSGYKRVHAQSVCTRPFLLPSKKGLGTRLTLAKPVQIEPTMVGLVC